MEFTFDFGASTGAPAATQPLYATVPGRASALGNNEAVFYDELLERTHVMTLQVLQAMDLCRPFRTLDAHVQAVVTALPQLARQQSAVQRVLEGLRAQGLLVADVTLLDRFEAADTTPRAAPFAGVFIRACNRPAQLERLLQSLADYERRFSAKRRYTLIDDSTDPDALARHADLLRTFAHATGAAVHHVQRDAWQSIIDELANAFPEHATAVRGLLQRRDGSGGGLGMNLALLLTAGARFALLDDDFVLPLHRHPAYHPGLAFGRAAAPFALTDADAALAAGHADVEDPFDRHLALCGETLASIARRADGCALGVDELRGLDYSRTPMLRPDLRINCTVNGHRGHSGAGSLGWVFLLDKAARAAALSGAEHYAAWLQNPAVWTGTTRHTVSARGNYTPFAIDNSRLMPCTAPDGRGEDALFANLVRVAYPRDGVMDLPFAIGHVQEGARARVATLSQAERPSMAQCFADLVEPLGDVLVANDPAQRLRGAASRLRDLGAGDTRTVQSYLREYLAHRRSQRIEALQRNFAAADGALPAWLDGVRLQIEVNGKSLTQGQAPQLADWPDGIDSDRAAARLRDASNRIADGLDAWPVLWQIASERREDWLARVRVR